MIRGNDQNAPHVFLLELTPCLSVAIDFMSNYLSIAILWDRTQVSYLAHLCSHPITPPFWSYIHSNLLPVIVYLRQIFGHLTRDVFQTNSLRFERADRRMKNAFESLDSKDILHKMETHLVWNIFLECCCRWRRFYVDITTKTFLFSYTSTEEIFRFL